MGFLELDRLAVGRGVRVLEVTRVRDRVGDRVRVIERVGGRDGVGDREGVAPIESAAVGVPDGRTHEPPLST